MASSLVEAALADDIAPPKTKTNTVARRRKPVRADPEEEYPDTGDEKHDVPTDDEATPDADGTAKATKAVDVARAPVKTVAKGGKKKGRPPPPGATRYSRVMKCFEKAYEIAATHESQYPVGMQKFVYGAIKRYCAQNVLMFRKTFGVIKEEQYHDGGFNGRANVDDIGMD